MKLKISMTFVSPVTYTTLREFLDSLYLQKCNTFKGYVPKNQVLRLGKTTAAH